jgi:transcriptional regulator with XRE-family HTH domain
MADDVHADLLRLAGQRVREARKGAGITQSQLAQRIGMQRTSVANLEAGRQDMTITRLAGIAQVLSLDLAAFIRPGELPLSMPPPHEVSIRPVLEVTCETCGGLVLDVVRSRDMARESKADHIAAMQEVRHA